MSEYTAAVVVTAILTRIVHDRTVGREGSLPDAWRRGAAATIVMTVSAGIGSALYGGILAPLGMEVLKGPAFLLTIWAVGQLGALFLRGSVPGAYGALAGDLRSIALDCAVLGVVTVSAGQGTGFAGSVALGFWTGVVATAAWIAIAGILERIDEADLPFPVRGKPILLLCAALVSMALMGLTGLSF